MVNFLQSDAVISAIPLIMLLTSLVTAVLIFPLPEKRVGLRTTVNLVGAVAKVALAALLVPVVVRTEAVPEFSMPFLPGVDLVLRVDDLSILFAGLSSLLWLATTVYAVAYMQGGRHRSRFFGFFSLCVTATVGISFAGNLVTFLVFYELLTLVTYPLIAHHGSPAALKAARTYLFYTLGGGLSLLVGVVWLTVYAGQVDFAAGGADGVTELARTSPGVAIIIFALLVGGLGVKAALIPLHGWLPTAMVAPAPVSALLHAVAVVKAGAFGIVRVVDDVYGIDVAQQLGVLDVLLVLAAATILYGSVLALLQSDLKKRLAYSTVSQVSYIAVGISLATLAGTTGGVVHLVHQGLMKITLFFCAGLFAEVAGATRIAQLNGLGRRMPWTSAAFTVGAAGMIGLPPTAGVISKWYLGLGALDSGHPWVLGVLIASTMLNAAYFLPILLRLWFRSPDPEVASGAGEADRGAPSSPRTRLMLWPTLATALASLAVGVAASVEFSPLFMARIIAEGVFAP